MRLGSESSKFSRPLSVCHGNQAPFCLMENVCPAIVIVPLRPDKLTLGATE